MKPHSVLGKDFFDLRLMHCCPHGGANFCGFLVTDALADRDSNTHMCKIKTHGLNIEMFDLALIRRHIASTVKGSIFTVSPGSQLAKSSFQ